MPFLRPCLAPQYNTLPPPSLEIDFLASSSVPPSCTFTRAGTANYFDSSGTLVQAASGVPVFEYDMATLAPKGFRSEQASTNFLLWCRDLTNAAWVKSTMTTAHTATGIDGTANSATTLTASSANGTVLQTLTRVSIARVTSAYVKRRTGTGTINMTQDNGTTWTVITVTASWTLVQIPTATTANPICGFRIVTSGDAIDVDYVQHEELTVSTSPIATTTASVARVADQLSISKTAFRGNLTAWTWVLEFQIGQTPASAARIIGADGSGGADPLEWNSTLNVENFDGSATCRDTNVAASLTVHNAVGVTVGPTGRNVVLNGSSGASATVSLTGFAVITTFSLFQRASAANACSAYARRLRYWPFKVAGSVLTQLTT
jgi:hypothetical protein